MTEKISRRDFLKISGIGVTAATVITGCGPSARYVTRQAYANMPEYNQTGVSTYYATTCKECPAGCGLIVRTQEGRAIKVEGNPDHPVNKGKVCSRGLTTVQGVYNPDRITGPQKRSRGSRTFTSMEWKDAITTVVEGMKNPQKTAFLLGLQSDHLFDLVQEISEKGGFSKPVRYGTLGTLEGRSTLLKATQELYGFDQIPFFDMGNADVVFSFGANFLETWLSPLAYSRGFRQLRKQPLGKRGYIVSFEARQSLSSANADEWIPIKPGSEGLVALAIGKIAATKVGLPTPAIFAEVNLNEVSQISGIDMEKLLQFGELFGSDNKAIALPGGSALTTRNGLDAAKAILALNVLVKNTLQTGGVFPAFGESLSSDFVEVKALIDKMNAGQVDTLFIHGTNPVFELPTSSGFLAALKKVKTVISFSTFEDETAVESDYVFPDHAALESFGYQKVLLGSDREAYSAIQPVVAPIHDTKATADVFLAAILSTGGNLANGIQYTDEVDYLQKFITPLIENEGSFSADELPTFWTKWLQFGGWWKTSPELVSSEVTVNLDQKLSFSATPNVKEGETFHLVTFATQMGDGGGANRPWLQETPDPMTTVTWNSWIEINPKTADQLGIHDDDIVEVKSLSGEFSIEAIVYRYPAIRPDTVAIPFGQGHSALGRYAEGRGCNPAIVWSSDVNQAGDLALSDTTVTIKPTGKRRPLARQESKEGVYGGH
ncbi:MAG: molybdopterin-dependent oxidoreductase [Anaerolineaceae bacterium]|nr:molybdopterin-dependent oxidoreductase [Anaerolineaceae bacterium]